MSAQTKTPAGNAPGAPKPVLGLVHAGAVTCIGNSAPQTLASFISHARRMRKLLLEGYADPFTIADCQSVTQDRTGVERLAALLESALCEATEGTEAAGAPQGDWLDVLVLPRWLDAAAVQDMQARFEHWRAAHSGPRHVVTLQAGADGAWQALAGAYRWLEAKPERHHVLIAAVDSECEPGVIAKSAAADWLLRPGNSEGYVAGEAGACVVLRRAQGVVELPAGTLAAHRPALADAGARLWPADTAPDFAPLAKVLRHALEGAGMEPMHISHLQSDMDGSRWRARLESQALGRAFFSQTDARPQIRLADAIGQVGAATGVLAWIIPMLAVRQKIDRFNTVLGWAVDREGGVAANVLERSPKD